MKNVWSIIKGKKHYWPELGIQDLKRKLKLHCGDEYFILKDGKIIEVSNFKEMEIIQVCSRMRRGSVTRKQLEKKMGSTNIGRVK